MPFERAHFLFGVWVQGTFGGGSNRFTKYVVDRIDRIPHFGIDIFRQRLRNRLYDYFFFIIDKTPHTIVRVTCFKYISFFAIRKKDAAESISLTRIQEGGC